MYSKDVVHDVLKEFLMGKKIETLSVENGISIPTIYIWLKRAGYKANVKKKLEFIHSLLENQDFYDDALLFCSASDIKDLPITQIQLEIINELNVQKNYQGTFSMNVSKDKLSIIAEMDQNFLNKLFGQASNYEKELECLLEESLHNGLITAETEEYIKKEMRFFLTSIIFPMCMDQRKCHNVMKELEDIYIRYCLKHTAFRQNLYAKNIFVDQEYLYGVYFHKFFSFLYSQYVLDIIETCNLFPSDATMQLYKIQSLKILGNLGCLGKTFGVLLDPKFTNDFNIQKEAIDIFMNTGNLCEALRICNLPIFAKDLEVLEKKQQILALNKLDSFIQKDNFECHNELDYLLLLYFGKLDLDRIEESELEEWQKVILRLGYYEQNDKIKLHAYLSELDSSNPLKDEPRYKDKYSTFNITFYAQCLVGDSLAVFHYPAMSKFSLQRRLPKN